ncbi:putative damage-inducible protein DinB [Salibacterium salarium]|uniref:DinB family protein n=1 Tax=Salibacterium salarium TaxID=284579 RepID=UPI0027822EEE|nr:DinB family protein [Salibacterium salarium]MDQ0300438.1 putative damage-inducible protein DinB [Salibacterium salarium]
MNEEMIFQQVNLIRQNTLKEIEHLSEEQADQRPEIFPNTIRWNLGHIYTVQNVMLSHFGGKNIDTPSRYLELFVPGTRPDEWQGEVPSLDELKQHLEEQPTKLKEALIGEMDEKAAKPFQSLSTVGEILNFTTYHEGLHVGTIKALKKANSLGK